MASGSESRIAGAFRELFSWEMYKRSQGRRVRQLTAGGLALLILWGLQALSQELVSVKPGNWNVRQWVWVAYGVPVALGAISALIIFRLYNWSRFADFLIATEAEMTKVSWSTKAELRRATIVVLATLFLFAGFLLMVDLGWRWILEAIGVLRVPPTANQAAELPGGMPALWQDWIGRS